MRRRGRVDDNQKDVVKCLRKAGVSVSITSSVGDGFPDLAVGYGLRTVLVELKDGNKVQSARKLTPDEIKWHNEWRGESMVAISCEEILHYLGLI